MQDRGSLKKPATPLFIKVLLGAAVSIAGLIVLAYLAFHLMPIETIEERARAVLAERTGVSFSSSSIERSFPFVIEAQGVEVGLSGHEPVVHVDAVRVRWKPLGVLAGALKLGISGAVGSGSFDGTAAFGINGASIDAVLKDIKFSRMPVLNRAGLSLSGSFGGDVSFSMMKRGCPGGAIELKAGAMERGDVTLKGIPLPVGEINGGGLSATAGDCRVRIEALWLDAKDMYASVEGEIIMERQLNRSTISLTLGITPRAGLLEKRHLLGFIEEYRRSANFYSIPIGGTIGNPKIGL